MSLMIPDNQGGFIERPPASVESLGNQIMTALNKDYPDWMAGWKVIIDQQGGVVQIRNRLISGKMGFLIKIVDIDPEMKKVRRYAGELLERYRISRRKGVDVVDTVNSLDRSRIGDAKFDE